MTAGSTQLTKLLARAQEMQRLGRHDHAAHLYEVIFRDAPAHPRWFNRLARARLDVGDPRGCVAACRRSLELDARQPLTLVRLATALREIEAYEEAAAACRSALVIRPGFSPAHCELGRALARRGALEEGQRHLALAVAADPSNAQAHFSLAMLSRRLGQLEPALRSFAEVLALEPRNVAAHMNRALVLAEAGRLHEALASIDATIAIQPDYADAHMHRAEMLLACGSYDEGWRAYEWRWRSRFRAADARAGHVPAWDGLAEIAGKAILVTPEVGLGDFIMFFRYVPDLVARGAKVILWVPQALHRLLATSAPGCAVVPLGREPPPADFRIPLMSLPGLLRTGNGTVAASFPYLRVAEGVRAEWAERLRHTSRFRVGLAWSGANRAGLDNVLHRRRSAPAEALAPLLELPVEFHSLQKEIKEDSEARPLQPAGPVRDHRQSLGDLADTAALIEQMDLVVTIDTAVAHLAGGLGKPLWVALPFSSDYRWPAGSERTPWYPQARLFRQARAGDWEGVGQALAAELAQELARAVR